VLRRGSRPVARLVALDVRVGDEGAVKRRPGRMCGRVSVPKDFDDWPDDVARDLGIST